jgi:hypothetical protein
LGHIIMGGGTEEQAQAWHLLIQQQYRRDNP